MPSLLLGDIGSTATKVALVDTEGAAVRAVARAPTTVATDVNEGFDAALALLSERIRPTLLSEADECFVCSSAAGGLRIVAVGLVPQLTAEAARLAALGAGGKVVGSFAYRLTREDVDALEALAPDLVLLAGGTDGGNRDCLLRNAETLAPLLPETPVLVAGNREARDEALSILGDRRTVRSTENVMPEFGALNLAPAQEMIRALFLERIVEAKGLDRLQARAEVRMPTPEAVFRAVKLLGSGTEESPGRGELVAVDIGGATVDVYSCADGDPRSAGVVRKGLREPFARRTVEADIGLGVSLPSLLEAVPPEALAHERGAPDAGAIRAWSGTVARDPSALPADAVEAGAAAACARAGIRTALARHVGRTEETFTPAGRVCVQTGKDLAGVPWIVGTGGALSRTGALDPTADDPGTILADACVQDDPAILAPRKARALFDREYVMWALGLLVDWDRRLATAMLRRYVTEAEYRPETRKEIRS